MKIGELLEFAPDEKPAQTPKLIHVKTGKEVDKGDKVVSFRGEPAVVVGWSVPHKPASTGRIRVKEKGGHESEYFPSVFDCEWINRTDRD